MENEIHFHKQNFSRSHESNTVHDEPRRPGDGTREAINEPYFHSGSSNTTLMQEVNDIISPSIRADGSSHADQLRGGPSIYSGSEGREKGQEVTHNPSNHLTSRKQMESFQLPPKYLADHLLDSYFNRVHVLYPFLHGPTFKAAYEKLWARATQRDSHGGNGDLVCLSDAGLGNSMNSGPESRLFYAGLNAMFALSCQFSDLPIPEAMEASRDHLDRAMALIVDTEQLDHPSLSLVQVLLLLCLHLQGTPLRNRLWNIIGMAFRIAQGLGLQIDEGGGGGCGHEPIKTVLEIEMRRRTWYSCVMIDMYVARSYAVLAMHADLKLQ